MKQNRIMMSDSYKYSHAPQYPAGTVGMYDYAEARSSKIYDRTVFIGLQIILKKYFSTPIEYWEIAEADMYAKAHGIPFDKDGWTYIVTELKGKLPVRIKAVPEGSVMPTNVPLFTIESTDEKVFWVVSWLETMLMKVWYPSNIATRSYFVKQLLQKYADKTQDMPNVDFQYHNFGYRGSSSEEAGEIGGVAHLSQFLGTDNFYSLKTVRDYYSPDTKGMDYETTMKNFINSIGYSIPASEHSTTTSWGREDEMMMILNHIENNKGAPIIAAVMDSYDYYNAVTQVTGAKMFREKIDSDAYPIFVIRPDSGDPAEVIPKTLDIMEINQVPYTTNNKGYKVFKKFRIIWGDGITMESMKIMLDILMNRGYSSENIAFGSGGWLMQQHDRDTQGWAVKCSSITIDQGSPIENGDGTSTWEPYYVQRDVFKDPITAPNKVSKKGKVTTYRNTVTKEYFVDKVGADFESAVEVLETVYENGEMIKEYSFDEVRANSKGA